MRRHPDLVAVFEGAGGQIAILLRHTLVPLPQERRIWLDETQRAARQIASALRRPWRSAQVLVLQWLPLEDVLRIVHGWRCILDVDVRRRHQLTRVAEQYVSDQRFTAAASETGEKGLTDPCAPEGDVLPLARPGSHLEAAWPAVFHWYQGMAGSWGLAAPPLRKALVLRSHEWIVARLLPQPAVSPPMNAPCEELAAALGKCLPDDRRRAWQPWVDLAVADLRFAASGVRHDERWARRLFLIPYSIPVPASARDDDARRRRLHPCELWARSRQGSLLRTTSVLLGMLAG